MSTLTDDQSSQGSSAEDYNNSTVTTKSGPAEDYKMNGLNEESAGSDTGGVVPKENGVSHDKHKSSSSSHKHGDGHKSSSDKPHKSSSSSSKHGSSSSSSKHKDGSSSSSKHRDGSSHHSSSSSSKHRDGSSSKHSSSSKPKEGGSSSSSHRDGKSSSSSSSKHKDGSSSSSKHSSSSSSKHKDGSSSSSSKHRDGKEGSSSSSKDKHSSSSSSDKDKHRDKSKESSSRDKDKHRSSSSGDKHKSSSGDKHKSSSGDKHKSSSSSDHKHKSSSSSKADDEVKVKQEVSNSVDANQSANMESPVKMKKEPPASPVKVKSSPTKKEPVSPVKKEVTPEKKPVVKSEDEESEDEDKPLSVRMNESRPNKRPKEESDYEDENDDEDDEEEDDDDVPLSARAKQAKKQKFDKKPPPAPKVQVKKEIKKEVKKEKAPPAKKRKGESEPQASPTKKKKKEEEEQEVWRWWEEQSEDTGVKWKYLEHKGPVFAPLYERVPKNVRFYYDGKHMELSEATEEVATFYGRMLDHDYTTRDVFNTNFFKDWKKIMTKEEREKLTDLKKCNFVEYNDYFKKRSEEKKAQSKEEKQRIKKENEAITQEYGFCIIDHHKEKIGNFRIEPPGLFRGRGDHPKQGMLKRRVQPSDVIINCSKDSTPPKAPAGHKWKEVRHDNTVTWLASWTENIQGATKYVMLNAASKLKGQKDFQKYEIARNLHKCVDRIRANYQEDWKSKEMRVRQRAVALYFIDKLALRAGNEKDDESADTVGCCSLRVEHISLHEEKDGKQYVVEFDFLGKDSIRYLNSIPVEKRVFKNLQLFVENKAVEDDLFDRLNTTILNKHLQDLMEGLTAKVFRTYNASRTLSEQLELLTDPNEQPTAKMLSYNRANRAVAILCNHQRAVPKSFDKSMENLQKKIDNKNDDIKVVKKDIKGIKADYKQQKSLKTKTLYEKKKKTLARLEEQLTKLEVQATDKDENKEIALGTSKLNYLDPRISVAWCKKFDVSIEKVYNKTQRDKFRWALDMATEHFKF